MLLVCCDTSPADETVQVCGTNANNVLAATSAPTIVTSAACPTPTYNGDGITLSTQGGSTAGQVGRWQAVTPAGLELVGASANGITASGVNDGLDDGGGFYWAGGGAKVNDFTPHNLGMVFPTPSNYFGMQLTMGKEYLQIDRGVRSQRVLPLRP